MLKTQSLWAVLLILIACIAGVGTTGCALRGLNGESATTTSPTDQSKWPQLPSPTRIEPGVLFYEVNLTRAGTPIRVWIYFPESHARAVPAVLIAPAGSPLVHGMALGPGDRPEHLPYVHAGFAVIAYEIEGAVTGRALNAIAKGAKKFEAAGYGVADARLALDYALARVPEIDPEGVVAAGHSSAATLALLVAASDPRIKGCIAYAPVCDVEGHLPETTFNTLSGVIPNFRSFLQNSSPVNHISELRCPVFLFHADDDSVVPENGVTDFAERLKKSNPKVTFVRVSSGDHYDSMIGEGIPAGIRWVKSLTGFVAGPKR